MKVNKPMKHKENKKLNIKARKNHNSTCSINSNRNKGSLNQKGKRTDHQTYSTKSPNLNLTAPPEVKYNGQIVKYPITVIEN